MGLKHINWTYLWLFGIPGDSNGLPFGVCHGFWLRDSILYYLTANYIGVLRSWQKGQLRLHVRRNVASAALRSDCDRGRASFLNRRGPSPRQVSNRWGRLKTNPGVLTGGADSEVFRHRTTPSTLQRSKQNRRYRDNGKYQEYIQECAACMGRVAFASHNSYCNSYCLTDDDDLPRHVSVRLKRFQPFYYTQNIHGYRCIYRYI